MSIIDEQYLKVKEVAAYLRCSNQTVYRLIHGGELTALRVGRTFRVSLASAEAWRRKNTTIREEETP